MVHLKAGRRYLKNRILAQGPFDKLRAGKADVRFEPEE
jgi:hypothetical protein